MTKLSQFMRDMRDSQNKVLVSEKQLRDYAQNTEAIIRISEERKKRINRLLDKVNALEAKIAILEIDRPDTIDLTS